MPGNLTLVGFNANGWQRDRAWLTSAATRLFDWVRTGSLTVVHGGIWALEQAADAHRALESRATTGKVLLEVR